MTRSERLEPVQRVMEAGETDAARALAQALAAVQEQDQRLNELEAYLAEYQRQMSGEASETCSIERLSEYRGFMARLNIAIGQQQRRVAEARATYEACRQAWLARRRRSQAVDRAVDRLQGEERRAEGRREQIEADGRPARPPAGD